MSKQYTIWTTAPHSGDVRDVIATYSNRGHALAALRGFRRRAWIAGSEMQYTIR